MTKAEINTELKRLLDTNLDSKKMLEERVAEFVTKRPEMTAADETAYRFGWMTANYDYTLKTLLRLTIEIDKVEP